MMNLPKTELVDADLLDAGEVSSDIFKPWISIKKYLGCSPSGCPVPEEVASGPVHIFTVVSVVPTLVCGNSASLMLIDVTRSYVLGKYITYLRLLGYTFVSLTDESN
jgi:hypothetical protein